MAVRKITASAATRSPKLALAQRCLANGPYRHQAAPTAITAIAIQMAKAVAKAQPR